jgi:protein tyrosine/serine phosphatase
LCPNLHKISDQAWRSGQPTPRLLRSWIRRFGIRTVICLRKPDPLDTLLELERKVCAEAGVDLVLLTMFSREIPRAETLSDLYNIYHNAKYPILIHCKAGAERSGLASTLYLHWMEGVPLDRTNQLTLLPHLHFKSGKTGIIDWFLESYLRDCESSPCSILEWAETRMRRDELQKAYRPAPLGTFITDSILRRE